jgi:PAS domain S-box-containing protein
MARTPEYLRLATSATRTLAEAAFDRFRDAVLVVDTRRKHLPVVLANAAAASCLSSDGDADNLQDSSLFGLLIPASAAVIESTLASLREAGSALARSITWRFGQGESAVMTEFKLLSEEAGQRLVMLTFPPTYGGLDVLSAVDQLPIAVMILNRELRVTYASAGAVRAVGLAGGLIGCSALAIPPTSGLAREAYHRARAGCHYRHDALEIEVLGGKPRCFEIDVQPLRDAGGVTGMLVTFRELGEWRLPKGPQGDTERHLRSLISSTEAVVSIADREGKLIYVSTATAEMLGAAVGMGEATHVADFLHPDDVAPWQEKYQKLVSGIIPSFSIQHRVRWRDGDYRWLESHYVAALTNPHINGIAISSRDVTKRKQTETQLAQREEIFRLAADAVDGVIFEWDLTRGIVHRSRGVLEILGIEPEDLAPVVEAWRERIHPRDVDGATRQVGLALIEGCGWTTTYRIRDARGRYRSMLERGLVQRSANGDPVRAIGCCVDVSEIKRLTDLLAEAQRTAQMGGWEYSYSTLELTWTEEMFRIYETTPSEFLVSWDSALGQFASESRERFDEAWNAAESGDSQIDLEAEITTLQNRRIWIRIIGHIEKLDGRAVRAYGSVQNIQAQKLAQIALENSTGWLKLSMNMAHMHGWRWNKATDTFEFAITDRTKIDLPQTFPNMRELMARLHPKDRMPLSRAVEDAFLNRGDLHTEFRLRLDGGSYRSYATIARPVFDASGAPQGFVGVTQDVTARRESEAKLRRSEQLLRTTTANTADTLMLVDTELRIRFINRGVAGMPIDDIVGCDISAVLPETACGVVVAKLRHVLNTGETTTYEFESRENGGEPQYFENRAVLVQDDGIGTGISISVTNITERKRLEQEILDVSSRERHTIGRDLHDGLGQELTGVALMLRGLATRYQNQFPEGVEGINEIVGLVNQSIETARALARGLLPVRTDSGGLPFALRELAARSRDLYGLVVNFRAEIWPEITLSEASASHLYRIAQEALTNAARHGGASKIDILLMVTKNTFLLRITDDGSGIGNPNKPVAGMGLKIMRYRAGMIGAKIEIGPNLPRGTLVRVTGEQPTRSGALQFGHAIYGGSEYGR